MSVVNIKKYLDLAKKQLRTCQVGAMLSFAEYVDKKEDTEKAFLINLPTGAGKTGVIALICHLSDAKKILVICHRKAVKDQLYQEIAGKFFQKTLNDADFELKKTYKDNDFNCGNGIYITSFQKLTLLNSAELEKVQEGFDLIIVDEGHSEPSPVWREIIRQSEAMKVVITATPYRNDLFELNVSTDHFYVYTFTEAVADGVISAPSYEQINDDNALIERLSKFLNADDRIKCIIKCKSLKEIEHYHNLISPHFSTASVHDRLENNRANNKFKRVSAALKTQGLRVIIHQHKLDEGVDIPEAKLLVLTYELGSGRELVQSVGRIVRRYDDSKPLVLDLSHTANEDMWEGYQKFDEYLAMTGAADFVKSLSTTYLIESFLDSFPQYSYFGGRFKQLVDLNKLSPEDDIKIPQASICFVEKGDDFSLPLLMDRLYWELHGTGALVKDYKDVLDLKIIIYIEFNSSKFFSNKLFFEPKLQVIIVKEIESGVAIFDSGGGRYYNKEQYRLGNAIHIDKLTALAATTTKHEIKETHARAIGNAVRRPESVALKGSDLNRNQTNQSNSRYALTMLKVNNIGLDGKKDSSYYIGARSGRVVDQKESNFTLRDISEWVDIVSERIKTGGNAGRLIKSYAQPISEKPDSKILSVLLDFTELDATTSTGNGEIHPEFIYAAYANGIKFDANGETVELSLIYSDETFSFQVKLDGVSVGNADHDWIAQYLDYGDRLKILYEDGITYLGGSFYRLTLPYEQGIGGEQSFAGATLFPIPELRKKGLKEKGKVEKYKYIRTTAESFDTDSIFYQIDQLKGYGDPTTALNALGPFAKYIPGCDLVLCSDMYIEPADFILSSPDKLCYVHVKCGKSINPKSSAGAIAEVGSQALKNIHLLISTNSNIKPGNFNIWHGKWPTNDAKHSLDTRYRLFDSQINHHSAADGSVSKRVWDLICERRTSLRCKKEIWVVCGNSFSHDHFIKSMNTPVTCSPESIQAFQLIEDWLSTANELDVDLKIFTSP
jgi:superfamily II DNA or RNA helicase